MDWADEKAEELLPCERMWECGREQEHDDRCPTHYSPSVAQALRDAFQKGAGQREALRAALHEITINRDPLGIKGPSPQEIAEAALKESA